jgi:hypothetical protein
LAQRLADLLGQIGCVTYESLGSGDGATSGADCGSGLCICSATFVPIGTEVLS